jgi:hypothetical protein
VHQLLLIPRLHRLLQGQGVSNLSLKKKPDFEFIS